MRRAAPHGDRDLRFLVAPPRERALKLDKAYWGLVREQRFERGRNTVIAPATRVFAEIEGNGNTALGASGQVYRDGGPWLNWE